jgi:hypothetical protein
MRIGLEIMVKRDPRHPEVRKRLMREENSPAGLKSGAS